MFVPADLSGEYRHPCHRALNKSLDGTAGRPCDVEDARLISGKHADIDTYIFRLNLLLFQLAQISQVSQNHFIQVPANGLCYTYNVPLLLDDLL